MPILARSCRPGTPPPGSAAMPPDRRGPRGGDESLTRAAAVVTEPVDSALDNTATRTRDIGGTLGTADLAAVICRVIERNGATR
ncbi:hypothetical protein [Streptomyces sp. NPDC088812]|uniref:hypothetical protein n=1 Tax=Streptomyces sp. NPDC088812 TaxID=3365905 RepID=UPI003811C9B0